MPLPKSGRIVRPLNLGEYDKTQDGQTLHVWVNPPLAVRDRLGELAEEFAAALEQDVPKGSPKGEAQRLFEEANAKFYQARGAWLSEILSQGPEGTHVKEEEIEEKRNEDPAFLEWLIGRIGKMMRNLQDEGKKN